MTQNIDESDQMRQIILVQKKALVFLANWSEQDRN